jgi:hypothetical protein
MRRSPNRGSLLRTKRKGHQSPRADLLQVQGSRKFSGTRSTTAFGTVARSLCSHLSRRQTRHQRNDAHSSFLLWIHNTSFLGRCQPDTGFSLLVSATGFLQRPRSARARTEARSVEVKDFIVGLDRIPLRFPGRQSALEKLDPEELKRQHPTQNRPTGFVARTRTVNNCIFFLRDQGRSL